MPRWYLEGSAVFMETWMAGGLGRAQGGYDEMVFRAMVRDNAHFYDPLGLVSRGTRVDFQGGANAYLYGGRFFTWLAYAHSPEKVVAWLRRDEGSRRHYADQFEQVFGISLERAWQDWIAFEHEFQRRNLAEVRKHPITPQRNLAATAMGSVSRAYLDEASGVLYAGVRYPGIVDHVAALNMRDGSARTLAEIKGAMLYSVTSLAFDPASRRAFFTTDNLGFRNLIAVDVDSGEETLLLKEARIGSIAFNPVDRSLIGVRHNAGLATLVRIPYPYVGWETVHEFPYGVVPSELDVSADGRLLSASITDVGGDQFLRVWTLATLLAGNTAPLSEFRFGQSAPESFVFTKDGRYLYGSSYYTGVSNIFRYEVATGDVKAVSNAETGFFRPIPMADGRLVVFSYTGEGFTPAIIEPRPLEDLSAITFLGTEVVARHPVVTTWQVPPANAVDYDSQVKSTGVYRPLGEVQLLNGFPVLEGYKTTAAAGYHLNLGDPLGFAHLGITAAYTPDQNLPDNERGHVYVDGHYLGWRAGLAWNRSNFYDLFGPTRRGRKGYAATLGYDQFLIFEPPRRLAVSYDLAYYDKIDTLPGAQNVETTFDRLFTGEIALRYTRRAPLARRRGGREGRHLDGSRHGASHGGLDGDAAARRLRRRLAAAARPLVGLVAQRRRGRQRRPQQSDPELLLRWLRQQHRRRRRGQALSRVRLHAGLRDRRDRRPHLRQADDRMEPAAGGVRVARQAELSSPIVAAGAVRLGVVDRSAGFGAAQDLRQPGRAGGHAHLGALLVRHDPLDRLCGRLQGLAAQRQRVDDFAEDPVSAPRC